MVITIQYSGSPDEDDEAAEWSWLDIPDKRNPECGLTDDFIHAFVDLAGQVADAHGVESADSFLLRIFGEEGVKALKIEDDTEIKGCEEEATFYSMFVSSSHRAVAESVAVERPAGALLASGRDR